MVEFPQDSWDKIKSFRTVSSLDPNARSFIIKDVVLKFLSTKVYGFSCLCNWFIIEDDIIHSKTFLDFQKNTGAIMKGDTNFLINIDSISKGPFEEFPFKFKKNELYKCDIFFDRSPNHRCCRGYEHITNFKKCIPLKQNSNESVNDVNKSLFINTNVKITTLY